MLRCKTKKGFSLLETMLVLSIGTGLLVMAFMMNKSRQEGLAVEDARTQLAALQKSLTPLKNVLTNYSPMISEAGVGVNQMGALFPKELLDATGNLSSAYGMVDVRSYQTVNAFDSYAISYVDVPPDFCTNLAALSYETFSQVRVGESITVNTPVWNKGQEFNPALVAQACASGRVVQFVSEPLERFTGLVALADNAAGGGALVPTITYPPGVIVPGTVGPDGTIVPPTPNVDPNTDPGDFTAIDGYLTVSIGTGVTSPPPAGAGATCGSQSFSWTVNGATCSGTVGGTVNSGSLITVANTTSGFMGGATVACVDGAWVGPSGSTCQPVGCAGAAVSWGGGCTGNTSNGRTGANQTVLSSASWTGSAQFTCNQGTWQYVSGTCTQPPPPPPVSSCSGYCGSQSFGGCTNLNQYSAVGCWWGLDGQNYLIEFTAPGAYGCDDNPVGEGGNAFISQPCSCECSNPGVCSAENGATLTSAPTSLCSSGTPQDFVYTGGGWTWKCMGEEWVSLGYGAAAGLTVLGIHENGGREKVAWPTYCAATQAIPVSGSCGTANGVSSAQQPSSNLCITGSPSFVSNGGATWNWSCFGTGGGNSVSCSAPNPQLPSNTGTFTVRGLCTDNAPQMQQYVLGGTFSSSVSPTIPGVVLRIDNGMTPLDPARDVEFVYEKTATSVSFTFRVGNTSFAAPIGCTAPIIGGVGECTVKEVRNYGNPLDGAIYLLEFQSSYRIVVDSNGVVTFVGGTGYRSGADCFG